MFTFQAQPQSLMQVYKSSIQYFKLSFPKIWIWVLIHNIIMQIPTFLIFSVYGVNPPPNIQPIDIFSNPAVIIGFIISLLVGVFIYCFIIKRMNSIGMHEEAGTSTTMRYALRRFFPALIVGIIIAVILLIFGVLSFTLAYIGIVFYILFLIEIAIMFFLIFGPAIVILEESSIFGALKRSCQRVWKHWWRNFVAFVVPAVIIGIIFGIINSLLHLLPFNIYLAVIAQIIELTIIMSYIYCIYLIQYHDLKLRHELKLSSMKPV